MMLDRPHVPLGRLRLLPFLLALAALALIGRDAGRARAGTPDGMEALVRARGLEFDGEWEAAEAAYLGAAAAGGDTAQSAQLDLARLYERLGRPRLAADLLAGLTARAGGDPRSSRAWFQYGSALQALGDASASIAAYRRAVELGSPAAAYARLEIAKQQAAAGDEEGALATVAPLFPEGTPPHARRLALRSAAKWAEARGRAADALAHNRALAALTPVADERIAALAAVAKAERAAGVTDAAAEAYRTLARAYPAAAEAEAAVEALAQLGRPLAPLETALVHYRRRRDATARTLYNQILAAGPVAAERGAALFYLGALAERRGEPALAVENYREAYEADPTGRLAADSLWWQGRVLRDALADDAGAQAAFDRLVRAAPESERAGDAAFEAGWIAYAAGRRDEARARWAATSALPRAAWVARGQFWAGEVAAAQGDRAAAQSFYEEAARRAPEGYYGLRAAAELAGQPLAPTPAAAPLQPVAADWPAAEAWLAGWAAPEDPTAWAALQAGEEWRAALALLDAGWTRTANDALGALYWRQGENRWLTFRLGQALAERGLPTFGVAAARSLIAAAPASAGPAPAAVQRLAYPLPWPALVGRTGERFGIDPLLLYAMMRQESAFNTVAGSSAGAFGLSQFIEGTAVEVARALGRSPFAFADLERPALAIEFGGFYLATQTRAQENSVYRGLAAYNGGGGSAARWQRAADSPDPDRFYEAIDFAETRAYVRIVIENYAKYRSLYGAADRPSIVNR